MSALCRAAADVSARGQRLTKRLVRAELITLILAAIAGLTDVRVGAAQVDVLAAVAGLLFLTSLGCLAYRSLSKPEHTWYEGRAAAESVRTMAWRYAVGGDPYPQTLPDNDAAQLYLNRITEILNELGEIGLTPTAPTDSELTPAMRAARGAGFDDRRAVYKRDRIDNQVTWYTARAAKHDNAARRWLYAAAAASVFGAIAAGLRMFGVIDVDLLGVAAACASAAIAWNQLNQNRNLVTAYRVAARELAIIRDRINHTEEQEWATFVSDAEVAISREHTMWLARRCRPRLA